MINFASIGFETANYNSSCICSLGIALPELEDSILHTAVAYIEYNLENHHHAFSLKYD